MSSGMVCLPVITFRHMSVRTHSTRMLSFWADNRRRRGNHRASRGAGKRASRILKLVEEAGRGCASWRNLGNQIFNADLFKALALNHLRSIEVKRSGVKVSTHGAASIAYDETVYAA